MLVGIKLSQVDGALQVVGWVIPAFTCSICQYRLHIYNRFHLRIALVCADVYVAAYQSGSVA